MGTYLGRGVLTLARGYLPTLARGYLPTLAGGTHLGQGEYPPWLGVPTLTGGVPTLAGQTHTCENITFPHSVGNAGGNFNCLHCVSEHMALTSWSQRTTLTPNYFCFLYMKTFVPFIISMVSASYAGATVDGIKIGIRSTHNASPHKKWNFRILSVLDSETIVEEPTPYPPNKYGTLRFFSFGFRNKSWKKTPRQLPPKVSF